MQFDQKRREFITLVGGAAAWPLAARAPQAGKVPTIGFLGQSTRSAGSEWVAAFVQRLRELGWSEGRTIAIEYRWGEGREERFAEVVAEFVRLKVDVIVTSGTLAVMAAKRATSVIPIVFATAGDPVANHLVASLARPGGNVTGLSVQSNDLAGKRIELLREVVPGLRRLAIMGNVDNPFAALEMGEVQAAAGKVGLEVVTLEIRRCAGHRARLRDAQRAQRSALPFYRRSGEYQPDPDQHPCGRRAAADHARVQGLCGGGRADVLRSKLPGSVSAFCRLCRQDSARGETGRPSGPAADQIRSDCEPDHGEGAWPQHSVDVTRSRRRGDRVKRRDFITLLGAAAAWPLAARAQQAGPMPVIGYLSGGAPGPFA